MPQTGGGNTAEYNSDLRPSVFPESAAQRQKRGCSGRRGRSDSETWTMLWNGGDRCYGSSPWKRHRPGFATDVEDAHEDLLHLAWPTPPASKTGPSSLAWPRSEHKVLRSARFGPLAWPYADPMVGSSPAGVGGAGTSRPGYIEHGNFNMCTKPSSPPEYLYNQNFEF